MQSGSICTSTVSPAGQQGSLSHLGGGDHFFGHLQPSGPQPEGSWWRNHPLCGQCCQESSKALRCRLWDDGRGTPCWQESRHLLCTRWAGFLPVPALLPSQELLKQEGHLEEGMSSHLLKCIQCSTIPCLSCCVRFLSSVHLCPL